MNLLTFNIRSVVLVTLLCALSFLWAVATVQTMRVNSAIERAQQAEGTVAPVVEGAKAARAADREVQALGVDEALKRRGWMDTAPGQTASGALHAPVSPDVPPSAAAGLSPPGSFPGLPPEPAPDLQRQVPSPHTTAALTPPEPDPQPAPQPGNVPRESVADFGPALTPTPQATAKPKRKARTAPPPIPQATYLPPLVTQAPPPLRVPPIRDWRLDVFGGK